MKNFLHRIALALGLADDDYESQWFDEPAW
jgi:hypothetical protein